MNKMLFFLVISGLLCTGLVLGQSPAPFELVINEVLFNPASGGYDYVEVYNRSWYAVDLQEVVIANRNSTGDIASQQPLTREQQLLQPGAYAVITANEKWVKQHYTVGVQAVICQVSGMPSFADDAGYVLLLNKGDTLIDELHYSKSWHFSMITDPSGVALERIHPDAPTQDKNNWTSASSSSGYGTPGLSNSQFQSAVRVEEEVVVIPEIFSPDNDGYDDWVSIQFQMEENGWLVHLVIYDMSGRKVRWLLKNAMPGISATYRWDGMNEACMPAGTGRYILMVQLYNVNGKTRKHKRAVVLVRR